ncbi:MAG: DoxX family protein [Chitinophagaceae bacterium]
MKPLIPTRIAMILFAIPFLYFGSQHLMHGTFMQQMVPFPPHLFWIYLTGVAQILAAIAFIFNIQARLAGNLTALFLLVIILTIQLPGFLHGDISATTMFFKDTGLMGGALLLANSVIPKNVQK